MSTDGEIRSTHDKQLLRRTFYLIVLLVVSWCVMTLTHETGHILCGWAAGGRLTGWELRPWRLPYSVFDPDPRPLLTLCGGPALGILVPLALSLAVRRQWTRFIATFCILANGLYLATGWVAGDRYLDAPQLLQHGLHPAAMAIYCAVTIPWGYIGFRRECIDVLAGEKRSAK